MKISGAPTAWTRYRKDVPPNRAAAGGTHDGRPASRPAWPPRQDPAHAEARQRATLLAAARRGYGATTLDHIAAELGATKGILYYYFTGKTESYAEIRATAIADVLARLDQIIAAGGPSEHLLARAISDLVEHIFRGLDQYANVLHEPHALGPENRRARA